MEVGKKVYITKRENNQLETSLFTKINLKKYIFLGHFCKSFRVREVLFYIYKKNIPKKEVQIK